MNWHEKLVKQDEGHQSYYVHNNSNVGETSMSFRTKAVPEISGRLRHIGYIPILDCALIKVGWKYLEVMYRGDKALKFRIVYKISH